MAIRDRLTDGNVTLTRSDLKVARVLLSSYPAAGLNTVAHLAQAAGVSGPTVVRFVARLGFEGYPDFQQALLAEVQERMSSPLSMMAAGKGAVPPDNLYRESLHAAALAVEGAMSMQPSAGFDRAVDLAADPALSVQCIGGRFSGYLAGMLWSHLKQLRPGCHWVKGTRADQVDALVDIGRRDLVIVYDYRRYQVDTIRFAKTAAAQGARIVLFTDPWASPIAGVADAILTAPVESLSPYDTMVPALAQTEALIAALTVRLAGRSRGRIEKMETLRRASSVTEDALGAAGQGDVE
ncbi:MAG: MurR/RpiR family transcriptional regulator [Proteobacteria bacterium]|nr:MurR/RpiR family transcriptional regulator [Pseudomonadota bacterium]